MIEKKKYFTVYVTEAKFSYLFRGRNSDVKVPINKYWQGKLYEAVDFIRIKTDVKPMWYIDAEIKRVLQDKEHYIIYLGEYIDKCKYEID